MTICALNACGKCSYNVFPDASGEIHYSCESIHSKVAKSESESNRTPSATIGWDFSDKVRSSTDVGKQFDRQGPDLFVQNGIPLCPTLREPIYAEVKKKPTGIFQVRWKMFIFSL